MRVGQREVRHESGNFPGPSTECSELKERIEEGLGNLHVVGAAGLGL
jgi:hypothetical protein